MNCAAEFEAALPEPYTILGLRLLPLSLGRYRLLKRFNCPFVADEQKEITIEELTKELFFALLVCGFPVDEFKGLLNNDRKFKKEARRFGKISNKIVKRTKNFNILEHFNAFKRYLDDHSKTPWVVLSSQNQTETSMAHWSSSMLVTLGSKLNWSEKQIDENPISEAQMVFFKYAESEGMVKLYDFAAYDAMQGEAKANGDALWG